MTELEYQENLRLAQGGDADAQFRLGYYFDEERCEYAEAWTWYERAAAQGCAWAWYNLAIMIQNGEHHAPDSALAAQYYLRAAECGDPDGLVGYAEILEESAETEADWLKIIGIYQRCNRPSGWYELALLYNKGNEFIPIDHVKANRWYRRAADAGHAKAATNLAFNLHDAIGCRRDWRQAFLYWKFAAEQGDSLAFLHLGETYALGHGTRRNYTKAFFWFRRCWFDSGMAAAAVLFAGTLREAGFAQGASVADARRQAGGCALGVGARLSLRLRGRRLAARRCARQAFSCAVSGGGAGRL